MPYSTDYIGIYKIYNKATNHCYVGQSRRVKKRITDHFSQLRKGTHPNLFFQKEFNEYGKDNFGWALEVKCETGEELDMIEEAFLSGEAYFTEKNLYNVSNYAKTPMKGRCHSPSTKQEISKKRRECSFDFQSEAYKKALSAAKKRQLFNNPEFVAKVRFILDNPDMSYAERGRVLGADTSSVRKLALKYAHLKGII